MSINDKEYMKNYMKNYRIIHKEEKKESSKKYYQDHKKEIKIYRESRKDITSEYHKNYVNINREEINNSHKLYRDSHPEKCKLYYKNWVENNPDQYRLSSKRSVYRRRRELDFVPLNSYFKGSNGHHLDNKNVIYIPEDIHQSYPHKQNKPESMNKINIIAWTIMESLCY